MDAGKCAIVPQALGAPFCCAVLDQVTLTADSGIVVTGRYRCASFGRLDYLFKRTKVLGRLNVHVNETLSYHRQGCVRLDMPLGIE